MHYWTCVVQKAIPVFTAYYCSASINIWTVKQHVWLLLPANEIAEDIIFSRVFLFNDGDNGGSHVTITHDALDPAVQPPSRFGTSLYRTLLNMGPHCTGKPTPDMKPHCAGSPRPVTSLCRFSPRHKTSLYIAPPSPLGFPPPQSWHLIATVRSERYASYWNVLLFFAIGS